MLAVAHSRFSRFTPRKVGQIADLIRGKRVVEAMHLLAFTKKNATSLVSKTLRSALSNAGPGAKPESFRVSQIWVGGGPTLKRMRAGSMGRSFMVRKRTAHLTIIVKDGK